MSWMHEVCEECLADGDCLFQSNNDVENCKDVQDYDED